MNFNELKRKSFFWLDKLQISRTERIALTIVMGLLVVIFSLNLFLKDTFNYRDEEYKALLEEFEKKSAALQQEQKAQERKYNPPVQVKEPQVAAQPDEQEEQKKLNKVQTIEIININTATVEELKTLHGIGDTYAKRIIEYREANGGFNSIDELVNVKGIGKKRLEKIKPFIKL